MKNSNFNIEWVKANIKSKKQFLEVFEAHAGNVDLDAEYEKIFPTEEKAPAKEPVKKD